MTLTSRPSISDAGCEPDVARPSRWHWLVTVLLAAVYATVLFSHVTLPTTAYFGGDTWEYQSLAANWATGHGLVFGEVLPFEDYRFTPPVAVDSAYKALRASFAQRAGERSFYRTPGYPLMLGILYRLVGIRPDIAVAVQLLLLVIVAAGLPILAEEMLGRGGLLAGLVAGPVFLNAGREHVVRIMTESHTAFVLFVALVAWAFLARSRNKPLRGLAFGLMLAVCVMTKGSLVFAPMLFLGYMFVQVVRKRSFTWAVLLVCTLSFLLPVAGYSAWASSKAGTFVALSTQGGTVLLDGNNEISAVTGAWSPQWSKENITSFYKGRLDANPRTSPYGLVASFYLSNPSLLPRALINKILALRHHHRLFVGVGLLFLCLLGSVVYALKSARAARIACALGIAIMTAAAVLSWWEAGIVASCCLIVAVLVFAMLQPRWRTMFVRVWDDPAMVAPAFVAVDFLLVTLMFFGDERFVLPGTPILFAGMGFLAYRLSEAYELPFGELLDPGVSTKWKSGVRLYEHMRDVLAQRVGTEISNASRYVSHLTYISTAQRDTLFQAIDAPSKNALRHAENYEQPSSQQAWPRMIVLDGVLNSSLDIQGLLTNLSAKMHRSDRISAVLYNPYYRWLYRFLDRRGLRRGDPAVTFVTRAGLESLSRISGCEVVRLRPVAALPLCLAGVGRILDGLVCALPLVRQIAPVTVATIRPVRSETALPSLAVLIPARNEKGNIASGLERLECLNDLPIQVIFVEGHSTDGTWEEILRVKEANDGPFEVLAFQQTGEGKADAVRMGLSRATTDLLTILDADLTVPPEMLRRFYDAYCAGYADFCNGSRFVYPMEGQAMRTLNLGGNLFFAKVLSHVLDVRLTDTLCGTKMMRRVEYERMVAWRADFGDFDPFGDFELLFPAASLGLGIVEVPIRYLDREYGATNISRFRHGLMLARMTAIGFWKIRMGIWGPRADFAAAAKRPSEST